MSDTESLTVDTLAEASVLGAVLFSPATYDDLDTLLTGSDFAGRAHKALWEALVAVDNQGRPIDLLTVADELRRSGNLELVGGIDTLEQLRQAGSVETLDAHVSIITDHSLRRKLIEAARSIYGTASLAGLTPEEMVDRAEQALYAATSTSANAHDWIPMARVVAELHAKMAMARNTRLIGVPTGIEDLDDATGGFQPGQLIVIAGRPGTGKSVLATQLAAHIAATEDLPVPFLSYEMSTDELGFRLLASYTGVDMQSLQRGFIPEGMEAVVTHKAEELAALRVLIDDNPPTTVGAVRSSLRRLTRRGPLGAVIIDYLQLMGGGNKRYEGRAQEVSEVSRELKLMAKELKVPVIACSQLSRQLMNRNDKRPMLSDLRESGSLEQDSSIVIFIHREHLFDPTAAADGAEIIIGKNRNGPAPRTINMRWDGPAVRFRPYEERQPGPLLPGGTPRRGGILTDDMF